MDEPITLGAEDPARLASSLDEVIAEMKAVRGVIQADRSETLRLREETQQLREETRTLQRETDAILSQLRSAA